MLDDGSTISNITHALAWGALMLGGVSLITRLAMKNSDLWLDLVAIAGVMAIVALVSVMCDLIRLLIQILKNTFLEEMMKENEKDDESNNLMPER